MKKDSHTIDFSQAKSILLNENRELRDQLQYIDTFFKDRLDSSQWDGEKRIESLFYLLLVKLKSFSIETPEAKKFFSLFLQEIDQHIRHISHTPYSHPFKILKDRVKIHHIKAFLQLCEYYTHTLEQLYKGIGMSERVMDLYIFRMNLKKHFYFFNKQFNLYCWFALFKGISLYGTSFARLSITCFSSILLFGSIYWLADFFAPENLRMIGNLNDYSSYLFNSLTTISGLWIDASPATALQRLAMGINAIYGMVVFGMLFNVISTKLSMNN